MEDGWEMILSFWVSVLISGANLLLVSGRVQVEESRLDERTVFGHFPFAFSIFLRQGQTYEVGRNQERRASYWKKVGPLSNHGDR